jgi:uncharacterized protein (DUF433 family)
LAIACKTGLDTRRGRLYSPAMSGSGTLAPPRIHIWLDAEGRAWLDDTNVKVIEVAGAWLAHGWSPEELCRQYPHLSAAQIHAALAYYHENREEFDAELQRSRARADAASAAQADSPLGLKLRQAKPAE